MKICLQGLVRNTCADIKKRKNIPMSIATVQGLQDIIVGLIKGDVTKEDAEEFLFNENNPIQEVEYYNSMIKIEKNK